MSKLLQGEGLPLHIPLPHRNTSLLYLTECSQRCGYMCAMLHITHINLEKGREIHQQHAWAEITQAWRASD